MVAVGLVQDLFTWKVSEYVETVAPLEPPPKPPQPEEEAEPAEPAEPAVPAEAAEPKRHPSKDGGLEISIGKNGVRIGPAGKASDAASVDISPEGVRIVGQAADGASAPVIDLRVPKEVSEAIRRDIEKAVEDAKREARKAAERNAEASAKLRELNAERRAWEKEYARELKNWKRSQGETVKRTRVISFGEVLWNFAWLWILFSAIVKGTYKGRQEAEQKAAVAEENLEAEALKRQLVEARLNTMQAQVEPHFLFNTLASIDHLIEVDPKRASQMQKNLIALLRATMPTMREANGGSSLRDLKREMAVVRPYLEILQVRMEERLTTELDVPEGLLSAEFPPMIIQGLVENAIKHGLEPKPEGGHLRVAARIEHGKLIVEVADTGMGFGRAGTSGTGVGLANTRERLQLLYGNKASLTVAENQPCGTLIRIKVPYRANEAETPHSGAAS
jgi:Histidine kinase